MTEPLYKRLLDPAAISRWTDKYFTRTRKAVETSGDCNVIYAVFLRRPSIMACDLAIDWLEAVTKQQNFSITIKRAFKTGDAVGAGEPLFFYEGPFAKLAELETHLLQKVGPVCVAAYNARAMVLELPHVPFIEMGARHCAGQEMAEMMAYAAHAATLSAKNVNPSVRGFIGTSTDGGAIFYDNKNGLGTMPHALVGFASSTLEAAKLYRASNPDADFTVLPDYFGREISDSIAVCKHFAAEAAAGTLKFRLDTHGGRYIEGLDKPASYAVIERNAPQALRTYLSESDQAHLLGEGVSAAAIWHFREQMDKAGFPHVKIIGSSGFGPDKCRIMKLAKAPLDIIGTGSFLPDRWPETYATADIIRYGTDFRVKEGREWLIERYKKS
ncbi:MAG: nicotinate phosphoribosyltransferase [Alphaproteobacteria bacterium]|nr:nicotinate phosphoribosyltransferase [Alphaproteobacteria bacterium]